MSNYPAGVTDNHPYFNDAKDHVCFECESEIVENEDDICKSCKEELRAFTYQHNLKTENDQLKKLVLETLEKLERKMYFCAIDNLKNKIEEMGIK